MICTKDEVLTCGFWSNNYEGVSNDDVDGIEDEWDDFNSKRGFPYGT